MTDNILQKYLLPSAGYGDENDDIEMSKTPEGIPAITAVKHLTAKLFFVRVRSCSNLEGFEVTVYFCLCRSDN